MHSISGWLGGEICNFKQSLDLELRHLPVFYLLFLKAITTIFFPFKYTKIDNQIAEFHPSLRK